MSDQWIGSTSNPVGEEGDEVWGRETMLSFTLFHARKARAMRSRCPGRKCDYLENEGEKMKSETNPETGKSCDAVLLAQTGLKQTWRCLYFSSH